MMTATTTCFSRDELRAFALGRLEEDEASAIVTHLEDCTSCEETIAELETDSDTLVSALREPDPADAGDQPPFAENSGYQHAIAQVKANLEGDHLTHLAAGEGKAALLRDYRLIEAIGQGGMGTVYKAVHTKLNRWFAIKLLPARRLRDAHAVARFRREMLAIGQMNHPAIVQATDAGELDETHFLVMEFVDGVDVSQVRRRSDTLSIPDACEIVRQTAAGLAYAHRQGIIHRDIKPSNLILSADGQVKILDLGLALLSGMHGTIDDLTTVGQLMGTLDYMAPEQCDNSHQVDARADVYSLGATLYKLLTGTAPYTGEKWRTPVQKLKALALESVPPIDEQRPDIPRELSLVIMKALSRDPKGRFGSMREFGEALEPWCAGNDLPMLCREAQRNQASADGAKSLEDALARSGILHLVDGHSNRETHKREEETKALAGSAGYGSRWMRILVAAASLAALISLGILITLETNKGTLRIESLVDDVEVRVTRAGEPVRQLQLSQDGATTRIAAGDYKIELVGDVSGIEVNGDEFTLVRGAKHVARIVQTRVASQGTNASPLSSAAEKIRSARAAQIVERERRLFDLKAQQQRLLSQYGGDHPAVLEVRREIELLNQYIDQLRVEVSRGPSESVPDPTKPLRIGDRLHLEHPQLADLTRDILVLGDGSIRLPYLGRVDAAGKSLDELQRLLEFEFGKDGKAILSSPEQLLLTFAIESTPAAGVSSPQYRVAAAGHVPDPTKPLRPGTRLHIEHPGWEELDRDVMILGDGSIRLPFIGSVAAAGKSLDALQQLVAKTFTEKQILRDSESILITFAEGAVFAEGTAFAEGAQDSKLRSNDPGNQGMIGLDDSEHLASSATNQPRYAGQTLAQWLNSLDGSRHRSLSNEQTRAIAALRGESDKSILSQAVQQWQSRLESERSAAVLKRIVNVLAVLAGDEFTREVMQSYIKLARRRPVGKLYRTGSNVDFALDDSLVSLPKNLNQADVAEAILKELETGTPSGRYYALLVLQHAGVRDAIEDISRTFDLLKATAGSKHAVNRRLAIQLLPQVCDSNGHVTEVLFSVFDDPDAETAWTARTLIARLEPESDALFSELERITRNNRPATSLPAVRVLGIAAGKQLRAIDHLIELLKDRNWGNQPYQGQPFHINPYSFEYGADGVYGMGGMLLGGGGEAGLAGFGISDMGGNSGFGGFGDDEGDMGGEEFGGEDDMQGQPPRTPRVAVLEELARAGRRARKVMPLLELEYEILPVSAHPVIDHAWRKISGQSAPPRMQGKTFSFWNKQLRTAKDIAARQQAFDGAIATATPKDLKTACEAILVAMGNHDSSRLRRDAEGTLMRRAAAWIVHATTLAEGMDEVAMSESDAGGFDDFGGEGMDVKLPRLGSDVLVELFRRQVEQGNALGARFVLYCLYDMRSSWLNQLLKEQSQPLVQILHSAYSAGDARTKAQVLAVASRSEQPEIRPSLAALALRGLEDPDREVVQAAVQMLTGFNLGSGARKQEMAKLAPKVMELCRHEDPELRELGVSCLVVSPSAMAESLQLLRELRPSDGQPTTPVETRPFIDDTAPPQRMEPVTNIQRIIGIVHYNAEASKDAQQQLFAAKDVQLVIEKLANDHERPQVRAAAAGVVAVIQKQQELIRSQRPEPRYDGRTFDEWIHELKTELKPERRADALTALATLGSYDRQKETFEAVFDVMQHQRMSRFALEANRPRTQMTSDAYRIRSAALYAIRKNWSEASIKVLVQKLQSDDRYTRTFALYALYTAGAASQSESSPAQQRQRSSLATTMLLEKHAGSILPELFKLLDAEDSEERSQVFEALGTFLGTNPQQIEMAFKKGLEDPAAAVRFRVMQLWSTTSLDPTPVLPVLISALKSPDKQNQEDAADLISSTGRRAKPTVPVLAELLMKQQRSDWNAGNPQANLPAKLVRALVEAGATVEEAGEALKWAETVVPHSVGRRQIAAALASIRANSNQQP